jgi:mono/diheme cytochrome c family protein
MTPRRSLVLALPLAGAAALAALAVASPAASSAAAAPAAADAVARGKYLVNIAGCHDCHTPWAMGPNGPAPDMTRMLSGHPEGTELPPPPAASGPWIASFTNTNTAWSGPWGISYTANLTPDPETGIGKWTEQTFRDAIRSGRHLGRGRPILPPMPWSVYRNMTDDDLAAVFAYLQSVPAIRNKVPEPTPPPQAASPAKE